MDLDVTKTIELGELRVVVRPANYRIGLMRSLYANQAHKARKAEPGEPNLDDIGVLAVAYAQVQLWPALISATVEHAGFDHWPITADEMMELPEAFVAEWEVAVFELNPQWRIVEPTPESAEKKAENG